MTPVVLLHGGGDNSQGLIDTFWDLGEPFTVIAWDREPTIPMSYELMTADTLQRLTQIGPAHLIGHSDGGIIALMLAAHHPEVVRSITVFGANYHHRGVRPEMLPSVAGITDPYEHALVTMWLTSPQMTVAELSQISCPALVAVGEVEPILDEHTHSLANAIPHSQLWVVEGADHDLPKDGRFRELVRNKVREFLLTQPERSTT